jgi:putative DNA primase/helicase
MIDTRSLAHALGGEVAGRDQVLAPGPGHSPKDRSLSVRLTDGDDFVVHSFAGDDPLVCKDYIRRKLGLPEW